MARGAQLLRHLLGAGLALAGLQKALNMILLRLGRRRRRRKTPDTSTTPAALHLHCTCPHQQRLHGAVLLAGRLQTGVLRIRAIFFAAKTGRDNVWTER